MNGKVWLVGAGPGDSGLLTRKGEWLLTHADVVVYDALASASVLAKIPAGTETIAVGKRAGNHPVPQWEINRILLREASEGKKVVRLKGGDPFVFGRGGEELELLAAAGIPFEIVPGVTSAVAVPAYAGIPVTHRDYTSSFHVITAHPRKGGEDRTPYEALAKLGATLVFLMGLSSMGEVLQKLMDAGLDPTTPAAVLSEGTTAMQRVVLSDAAHLAKDTADANIAPPAIFMVGAVCPLAEEFSWAEARLMGKKRVLLCTSGSVSSRLEPMLCAEGAEVIALPTIEQRPLADDTAARQALVELAEATGDQTVVLTSPVGVDFFFRLLEHAALDLRQLLKKDGLRFAVIGSQTKKALQKHGIFADWMPQTYSGKALGELLCQKAAGSRVWLFRSSRADDELPAMLQRGGLAVREVHTYDTVSVRCHPATARVQEMIAAQKLTCAAFTSASAVEGFAESMGPMDFTALRAVCIGEKTAEAALRYGMQAMTAPQATLESMTQTIRRLDDGN